MLGGAGMSRQLGSNSLTFRSVLGLTLTSTMLSRMRWKSAIPGVETPVGLETPGVETPGMETKPISTRPIVGTGVAELPPPPPHPSGNTTTAATSTTGASSASAAHDRDKCFTRDPCPEIWVEQRL